MRRGIKSLLFKVRHKIHVVDSTFMPVHLTGTALINVFPYSVEIEPVDLTRFPNFPIAIATLFLRTSDGQELDSSVVEEFEKNINYKFEVAFEKDCNHYVQVR